jgi:hypothetical protein
MSGSPTPPGISTLPNNKGLEALAFAPRRSKLAGALIAFSERGLDADGNLKAFLIGGPTPGEFAVKRRNDFDISDCTVLPSGDLLLLERRFSLLRGGFAMRLRRIALADIAWRRSTGRSCSISTRATRSQHGTHRTAAAISSTTMVRRRFLPFAADHPAAVQTDRGMSRGRAKAPLKAKRASP